MGARSSPGGLLHLMVLPEASAPARGPSSHQAGGMTWHDRPALFVLGMSHAECRNVCYTEKAPNTWHGQGTQKTGNNYYQHSVGMRVPVLTPTEDMDHPRAGRGQLTM